MDELLHGQQQRRSRGNNSGARGPTSRPCRQGAEESGPATGRRGGRDRWRGAEEAGPAAGRRGGQDRRRGAEEAGTGGRGEGLVEEELEPGAAAAGGLERNPSERGSASEKVGGRASGVASQWQFHRNFFKKQAPFPIPLRG